MLTGQAFQGIATGNEGKKRETFVGGGMEQGWNGYGTLIEQLEPLQGKGFGESVLLFHHFSKKKVSPSMDFLLAENRLGKCFPPFCLEQWNTTPETLTLQGFSLFY